MPPPQKNSRGAFVGNAATKIVSYLLIIALGYLLKKARLFRTEHSEVLSRIILNITLPCVIVTGFQNVALSGEFAAVLAMGFVFNAAMLGLGAFFAKRAGEKDDKVMYGLFIPSQNIGIFGAPIVQACFSPTVSASIFIFDIGNAAIMFGPSFIIASAVSDGRRVTPLSAIKKLLSTAAFDAYILVIALSLLDLKLPAPVLSLANICGAGNGFLAMLFFGIMLEPRFDDSDRRMISKILLVRLAAGAAAAIFVWTLHPIQPELKIGVTLCLSMPIATASAAYASGLNCKKERISGVSALSLFISAGLALLLAVLFS